MKVKYNFEAQAHTLTLTPETDEEEKQLQAFFLARSWWEDVLNSIPGHKYQQLRIYRIK